MLRMGFTPPTQPVQAKPVFSAPNLDAYNYRIEDDSILGKGCSRTSVVRVHLISDPTKLYAAKITNKHTSEPSPEADALKQVQGHPNVIRLERVINTNDYRYIIMELAPRGTVMEYLEKHGPVSDMLARKWIRQIISALQHCCNRGVVHMDLKPANLFLDNDLNIKVGDFGLISISPDVSTRPLKEAKGSAVYAAPELYHIHEKAVMALPALMWTVGVILHAMLTLELPYSASTYHMPLKPYTPPACLSQPVKDFLSRLLVVNPDHRLQPSEVLDHPWFHEKEVPVDSIYSSENNLRRSCSALALQHYGHDPFQKELRPTRNLLSPLTIGH